ncbi:MAG: tetratricopeptide repeat protein [Magnetococcales bacterium]|nr:tetratricopeptide repeat protein [Magnetococcales bacterium]
MSIIYRALRKEKRAEAGPGNASAATLSSRNPSAGDDAARDGGLLASWGEVLRSRWSGFGAWFADASLMTRSLVVAAPVLVFALLGGGGYWVYKLMQGPSERVAVQEKQDETVKKEQQENATKAADEALFAGAQGTEGEAAPILAEEPLQEAVAEEDDAFSEEKMLAKFFSDSAMPEVPEAKAAPGKEPPPLEVTPEEEEAALGKARLAKAKESESVVVSSDVQESRERDVGRVVGDLRLAMSRGDAQQVEQLLATLGQVKAGGEKDPFVLNMRAYWEISRGRHDNAAAILKQILERRPDDLEAGLNMAVVEMRTSRPAEAKARLFALLKLYPGDSRPNEMLRFLR